MFGTLRSDPSANADPDAAAAFLACSDSCYLPQPDVKRGLEEDANINIWPGKARQMDARFIKRKSHKLR